MLILQILTSEKSGKYQGISSMQKLLIKMFFCVFVLTGGLKPIYMKVSHRMNSEIFKSINTLASGKSKRGGKKKKKKKGGPGKVGLIFFYFFINH